MVGLGKDLVRICLQDFVGFGKDLVGQTQLDHIACRPPRRTRPRQQGTETRSQTDTRRVQTGVGKELVSFGKDLVRIWQFPDGRGPPKGIYREYNDLFLIFCVNSRIPE